MSESHPSPAQVSAGADAARGEIRIGLGSFCVANGSGNVHAALRAALAAIDLDSTLAGLVRLRDALVTLGMPVLAVVVLALSGDFEAGVLAQPFDT